MQIWSFLSFVEIMRIGELISKYIKEFSEQLPENISVIDIGCGKGDYSILLKTRERTLYGLDICNQLKREYFGRIKLVIGDATYISFPDAIFDVVVSCDVIEHIKDDNRFLSEFFRILKPGGWFLLGTPNKNRLANVLKRLIGRPVQYPYCLGSDLYGDVIHIREYERKDLIKMLEKFTTSFKVFSLGIGISGKLFCKNPLLLKKYCSYYLIIGQK